MRLLLIDHGRCDPPGTRAHRCRRRLEELGVPTSVCGPASVPNLVEQQRGMHGIHLADIAAASRPFLEAVVNGSPESFLAAVATISPGLLGLIREAARQTVAEAVDASDPDAIFVLHAGIFTDLAIETGIPVAVHVSATDLDAAGRTTAMRELVAAALGSCDVVVAADRATAELLDGQWLPTDALSAAAWAAPPAAWPTGPDWADSPGCAGTIAAACRSALARRRGPG